jgi:hypothetical protein
MRLAPRRTHVPGLAIGKERIAVLTPNALVVSDTAKFDEVARIPMHQPTNLAVTADGSFVATDTIHTVRLLPGDTKHKSFPPVVLFPESALMGDRQTPDRFWVLPGHVTTLYGYVLGPSPLSVLTATEWIPLDGFDGRLFSSLRDGSFLYSADKGFRHFYGAGKKEDVTGTLGDAFRLLPGSRVDTLWLVSRETAVLYRLVAGKLYELRSISLSTMPFDVDADGEYLALLELAQPADAPWSFVLEVFDIEGKRRLHETLSAEENLEPKKWIRVLLRNRRLALSAGERPLVAVGGPDDLSVFRADDGTRIWHRP